MIQTHTYMISSTLNKFMFPTQKINEKHFVNTLKITKGNLGFL